MFSVDQFLKQARPRKTRTPKPPRGKGRPFSRKKALTIAGLALGGGALLAVAAVVFVFAYFGRGLPDIYQLEDYEPKVVTRIHAGDGTLLTEYATEKRLFVPIDAVPPRLIQAYIAAEDKNFYGHPGIDVIGIVRSAFINLGNVFSERRPVGGSTITQQVAKNFLLSSEVSYERKIREAILALRMERVYNKNEILELYMNDAYLGFGSYGVAAAALNYFGKALDELTLPEMAYLAALLKAPSNYHPLRYPEAAESRRNWVLDRMQEEGFIGDEEYREARAAPFEVNLTGHREPFEADYFEEEVRRELLNIYGERTLYGGGLSVHSSLEPELEAIAERTLREGLVAYDRRHGWRGPVTRMEIGEDWAARLGEIDVPLGFSGWRLAVVLGFEHPNGYDAEGAVIGFEGRSLGFIPFAEAKWAQAWLPGERLGRAVENIQQVLEVGDVIPVERAEGEPVSLSARADGDGILETVKSMAGVGGRPANIYALRQVPEVEGALVAMDPHTGRVLAMVGGYDFAESQFNRATQAQRQTGSAFKPFVYAAALENGFTPSTLVLDAPFVIDQGEGRGKWKPRNSSNVYYGPSTIRLGLEKSRNLMTVRLAQYLGMRKIVASARRFGIGDNVPPTLAGALGAGETTLLKLTTAYATLVNGGYEIEPSLIDRIQNRYGETIYKKDTRECIGCRVEAWNGGQPLPRVPDARKRVIDPRIAYQLVLMLEGVVRDGTGRQIHSLGIPLAGKTGTTNDATDAWFVGFSPDLVVGVFVGFDTPKTLGPGEEGSSVAVPIFKAFMKEALKGEPAVPFRIPAGVRLVRVNADTGLPAGPGDKNVILEAFIPGTEPAGERLVLDGQGFIKAELAMQQETSGIY